MIKLYRICSTEHIRDLSGIGARIYGGRWNNAGYPIIYSSCSRSLAALEFLVHVPMALSPDNLSIAEMVITGNIKRESITNNKLPSNWRAYPAPEILAEIGTKWIKSKSSLLLDIPSAVVDKEVNTLINPLHPDMKHINIETVEKFHFDSRLVRQ